MELFPPEAPFYVPQFRSKLPGCNASARCLGGTGSEPPRPATVRATSRMRGRSILGFWPGRLDLNSGPIAPQARNIIQLGVALTENKRAETTRFRRQLDAKPPVRTVWTPHGLHHLAALALGCQQAVWARSTRRLPASRLRDRRTSSGAALRSAQGLRPSRQATTASRYVHPCASRSGLACAAAPQSHHRRRRVARTKSGRLGQSIASQMPRLISRNDSRLHSPSAVVERRRRMDTLPSFAFTLKKTSCGPYHWSSSSSTKYS